MATLAYALTTVARVKTYLGITAATWDTLLESLVDSVTAEIETYCDRRIKQTAYTNEEYNGTGTNTILLRQYPVATGETFTLQQRDSADNQSSFSSLDSQEYFVDDNGLVRFANNVFLKFIKHYRVSYTAGIDFDAAGGGTTLQAAGAGDLELACWKLIATAFYDRKNSSKIKSESLADYSVTFARDVDLDPSVKSTLEKYRRPYGD